MISSYVEKDVIEWGMVYMVHGIQNLTEEIVLHPCIALYYCYGQDKLRR